MEALDSHPLRLRLGGVAGDSASYRRPPVFGTNTTPPRSLGWLVAPWLSAGR